MSKLNILGIDGARRKDSASRKILKAMPTYFHALNADFHIFDQSEQALPLYDDDSELQNTASVVKLLDLVQAADGIVLCSPEYHNSMSGSMKNALDWLTSLPNQTNLKGKTVGLIGGGSTFGNSGALVQMMMSVRSLHAILMPEVMLSVSNVWEAIDKDGDFNSTSYQKRAQAFAERLCVYTKIMKENSASFK